MTDLIMERKTCLSCGRFPLAYTGTNWNCRAGACKANRDTIACGKWIPEVVDDAVARVTDDELREALNRIAFQLPPLTPEYPEPPPPPPGLRGLVGGVVYFIRCFHLVKIGTTEQRIEYRIKNMTTDNPFELRLIALVKGRQGVEREAHRAFSHYRHRGEWFSFDAEGMRFAKQWILSREGEIYEHV